MNRADLQSKVKTIVVVIMENRSFDHVLGHLSSPQFGNRTNVEGIADPAQERFLNFNSDGVGIPPFWTDDGPFGSDLPHDPPAVQKQLALSSVTDSFLMNGFVRAFEDEFHTSVDKPPVMGLLRPSAIPTMGALASHYTVCDHWFACLPTSTAPNRLMSMCGYTDHADTGTLLPNQDTVYKWLTDRGVSWRVYAAGLPFFLLMPQMLPLVMTTHFRRLSELRTDVQSQDPWPQVIFIEPDYYDCPVHLQPPCDNHAPLAMAPGEAFLAQVYAALTSNPARWAETVLIVTHDEHGGFFDHVPPLPVKYRNPNGVAFDSTGPRVPAIVAGPFAASGVFSGNLDNTSILQLLAERFGKPGEAYSQVVAGRAGTIGSVSSALSTTANNTQVVALGTPGASAGPTTTPIPGNSKLQTAFQGAITDLVNQHSIEALAKFPELKGH
jgi:phospholipase C